MITAHDGKYPARVGKLPLFYILDPGPIDPDGDIMLGFAGNRAGVAADARALVYGKAVAHAITSSARGSA